MSEQQEIVLPSDSVSSAGGGKKKNRPGKNQRMAIRSDVTSQASASTGVGSIPKAMAFKNKAFSAPVPQPGKYPVVFQTGAGEPTQDSHFAISGSSLAESFMDLPEYFKAHARYAEYAAHLGAEGEDFLQEMVTSSLLGLAQQVVHAHVNMGLPMGDFSSISSTDIYNPTAVRAVIHQFGEFSVQSLGTRYLFQAYDEEVAALVRTAKRVSEAENKEQVKDALLEHWLPVVHGDKRTRFILAVHLVKRFERFGISVPIMDVYDGLYTEIPASVNAAKHILPDGEQDLYDWMFRPVPTHEHFKVLFCNTQATAASGSSPGRPARRGSEVLRNLNLQWKDAREHRLDPNFSAKVEFPELAMTWLKKKAVITKFFSCGSGLAEKSTAVGSATQLAEVSTNSGITVVRSLVASSADEYSLCACFPPTCLSADRARRNVVLSTPLSAKVRAAEFAQQSWL